MRVPKVLLSLLGVFASTSSTVFAAPRPPTPRGDAIGSVINRFLGGITCSTTEVSGIFCVLINIINTLLKTGGVVAFLFLLWGGLQYMISGGDEKAITTSKSTITYAVLGLGIILTAVFLVNYFLADLLGVV